jgi:hypothetical protein
MNKLLIALAALASISAFAADSVTPAPDAKMDAPAAKMEKPMKKSKKSKHTKTTEVKTTTDDSAKKSN